MSIAGSFLSGRAGWSAITGEFAEKKFYCEKTKKKRQHVGLASFFV
jgi:hypothetical protein